jgi:prophage regulatory protein
MLIRLDEVIRIVGLKKSWIYAAIRAGRFPRPVQLGDRAVGWRLADIEHWVRARPLTPADPVNVSGERRRGRDDRGERS